MNNTVFELAEENGGAGFWIAKPNWTGTVAHVVYVGDAGAMLPNPEEQVVLMDIYSAYDGTLKDELVYNGTANRKGVWEECEIPDFAVHKDIRGINDPSIVASLSERRDGLGCLAPKKPGKARLATMRLLHKAPKYYTFERSDQGGNDWAEYVIPFSDALSGLEIGKWYDIEVELDRNSSRLPTLGTKTYRYFSDAKVIGPSDFDGVCARAEVIVKGLEEAFQKYGDLDTKQQKSLKRYEAVPEYTDRLKAVREALPEKAKPKRAKKVAIEDVTEGLFKIHSPHHKQSFATLGKGKSAQEVKITMGDEIRKILRDTPVNLRVRYAGEIADRPHFEIEEFLNYEITTLKAAKAADEAEAMVDRGCFASDLAFKEKTELLRGQEKHTGQVEVLKARAEHTEVLSRIRFCEEARRVAESAEELEGLAPDLSAYEGVLADNLALSIRYIAAMTVDEKDDNHEALREIAEDCYKYWRMPDMKRGFCLLVPDDQEIALQTPLGIGSDLMMPSAEGRSFEIRPYHATQYGWHLADHVGETGRLVYGRLMTPAETANYEKR